MKEKMIEEIIKKIGEEERFEMGDNSCDCRP